MVKRASLLCAVAALLAPAGAAAHATVVRTVPASGAVLAHAPRVVRVQFDDTIRVAPGNAVISNATRASVLAGEPRIAGRALVLPIRGRLGDGAYSVRWSIVSDDGHREQGVLAFGVGAGGGSPQPVLGASAGLRWTDAVLRTLYYLGLLVAAGATGFALLARPLVGERLRTPLAHVLFFGLLAVFLGGSGILHGAAQGTRFTLVLKVALAVAAVGGAAAALAPSLPRLLPLAGACSVALLAAPALAGHALDRNQPRALSLTADLAHLASAALWLGGLVSLVYILPRTRVDEGVRLAVARRFSNAALASVATLGLSGLTRALTELSHASQVWSTSYGRALIAKTTLLAPLAGIGWLNRTALVRSSARLRRSAMLELALIAGIVVTVAILTELRPGRDASRASAATAIAVAQPPGLPPKNAETTRFEIVAPHSRAYATRGGPSAIVIGTRRRGPERAGAPLLESAQTPLEVTQPYGRNPTNVHLVAAGVLRFFDRRPPAWFRVALHGVRPAHMQMTAAAHFMVDRYVGFDGPVAISPPPSR